MKKNKFSYVTPEVVNELLKLYSVNPLYLSRFQKPITQKIDISRVIVGIYFLIKESEVVYVGQSVHVLRRIQSHFFKDYDSCSILSCDKNQLDFFERAYINKYRPIFNTDPVTRIVRKNLTTYCNLV